VVRGPGFEPGQAYASGSLHLLESGLDSNRPL